MCRNFTKKLEPHRITFYLYELATLFHSYWNEGNRNDDYKFIINNKIHSRLKYYSNH